jgi:hypothetical protein
MQLALTPHEQAVALLTAAYTVPGWPPETLRLYSHQLGDIEPAVLHTVVLAWIRSHPSTTRELDGRPEIADLRRAVAEHKAAAAGTPYLPVDDAWARVQRGIERLGRGDVWLQDPDPERRKPTRSQTRRFVFHCPRLTLTVQRIGLYVLSELLTKARKSTTGDESFLIHRFRTAYERVVETDLAAAAARRGCEPLPMQRPGAVTVYRRPEWED